MTRPAAGLLWGTTKRKRTAPSLARARTASNSLAPPRVRLATTRTSLMPRSSLARRAQHATCGGCCGGGGKDSVDRTGNAVLVRATNDSRQFVEVEDGRRRGDLPLERHAAPGVGDRDGAATPACDHVVDEHQRADSQREAG